MYIWSTSGDERVRGDPSGFYPDARFSHYHLDDKLCRWDDSSVYSEDGGRTWKDRPASWCQLHPGVDFNCRCTALAYWNEIVDEADEQIQDQEQETDKINVTNNEEEIAKTLKIHEDKIKGLNHEECVVVGRDGKYITKTVGQTSSVEVPAEAKGNIATHNHPGGACAFSVPDVRESIKLGVHEVRAVTSDGRFVSLREGSGILNGKQMVADFVRDVPNGSTLFIKASTKATHKHGRNRTHRQILDEMENIVNGWFVDNANKYGYIFTQGRI